MATTYEMGFINVPISPTFVGIAGKLNDQLIKPARDAGKKAATEVEKSVEASVKSLERQVAASTKKLGDLDRAHQDSMSKREAQQGKLNAAIAEQSAAEEKYQQALKKGDSGLAELAKVEKAKAKVTDETLKLTKAERDITDAEQKHKKQLEDLQSTTEKYEQAQNEAGKSTQSLRDRLIEMNAEAESAGGIFDGLGGKIGGALKGLAIGGVAATGAAAAGLVKLGTDFDDAFDTIRIGTGASGEAFDDLVESAKSIANEIPAMDGGFGQISSTLADLNTRLGLTGEPLETMTSQFVQLSNMGVEADINEISAAMSQFGIETDAMPDMMDSLFQISQATGLSMTELTSSLSKSGPALQEFGFGLEESAGLLGQLDKAGLNSEQMMGAMTKALQGFADSGKEPQEALWGTISSIEELQSAGKDMEALDLANSVFGPKGGAQFVQAIGDGQFAWDDFMGSIGATEDTILGIADETADFAESWQLLKQKAMDALQPIATALFDQLAPALDQASTWIFESLVPAMEELWEQIQPLVEQGFEVLSDVLGDVWRVIADDLVPAFQELGGWIQDNQEWLIPLSVAVGGMATGMLAWTAATKAYTFAQGLATKSFKLFDGVTKKSMIGMVVMAVTGLVSALIWFFRETELGQEIWGKFTDFLKNAWESVSEKFGSVVESISNWWNGLTGDLSAGWESIKSGVFDAWNSTVEGVQSGWETFTGALGAAWNWVKDTFTETWNSLKSGVFDVWTATVDAVKAGWDVVTGALGGAWTWLKDTFVGAWELIKTLVFDAFMFYVDLVKGGFQLGMDAIGSAWDWVKDKLNAGYEFIRDTVFGGLDSGLEFVKGSFGKAVDAIGKIWDGLKKAAMAPVKFVVDTVWNDGLLRAINAVTKFIGMEEIQPIQIGFARGGILPGYSRMADGGDQLVPMRRGEGVLVSEGLQDQRSRDLFLDANEWAKRGGSFAEFVGEIGAGKATGGIINYAGALSDIQQSHARFVARFFPDMFAITSASRSEPGSMHDFSARAATDLQAQDGHYATQMPTPASKSLARAIATNFPNTAQLIHWPEDGWKNIYEGNPHDYGPGTNAMHGNHVHWGTHSPLIFDGDDIILTDAGGSAGGGGFVKGIWDKIVNAIPSFTDGVGGWFDDISDNFLKASAEKLWNFISEKVSSIFSFSSGGGATQWADLASQALARMGYGDEHLDAMLQQIQIESTGDPNAVNMWDSNALAGTPSGGLLQVIEPTYRDVRNKYPEAFEGLPDDRFDPLTNLVAGVGAVKRDWGGPAGRWPTRDGYAEGGIVDLFTRDLGGWVPDGALVRNTSGRDELMLPPELSQAMTGFFNDYPEAASSLADAAVSMETASEWLAQAADYSTSEGAVARAVTRGILGIGIDLPGADLVSGFLDAEEAIWESRLKYSKHIDTIAEKEKALADALEALAELGDGDGDLGTKDQRKLDDAIAKVEEDKANLAKADSDEKRAKAADKLADSEEKLRRVREDLDESAAKSAEKHAEDITKANEAVAKAEAELVEAKRQQASDLHAITILSADSLSGMQAQANGFASQLIGMGAPADLVTQGLGAVSGALGSVAGMAGPAGLTLGMALDIAKSVIQLVQMLEQMWKEIVEKITTYRTALLTGQADFLSGIAEINSLVADQKLEIVSLANEWVDATLRMRDAIRGITEAAVGVLSANLQGAKAIADIQKKILGASSRSSGGAFTDLHDMGLLYDSHADMLTATPRIKSTGVSSGGGVSGIAASVDEIAALEWELLAAEKNHSIMMIDAMIGMVDAQFEQIQATRDLERLEADRDRAWARLLQMQEIQTQFAINEQQAIVQEQINELLRQNAEAESVLLDPMNRLANLLDVDGDGTFFGLFTNKGSIAVQAAQNTIAANNAQIEKLIAMQQPYGGTAEITPEMQATLEKAARLFAEGMDREAQWLLDSSALGDPARALQIIDLSERLAAIDNDNLALEREWEDLKLRLDHIEATEGLESLREGLQHDREYALASAEILRATSDEVRKAAEALRDYHAQAAAQKPTVVTVNVPAAGTVVDADVLDQTLTQLGQQLDGVEIRTERLEKAGRPTGGSVLVSKS